MTEEEAPRGAEGLFIRGAPRCGCLFPSVQSPDGVEKSNVLQTSKSMCARKSTSKTLESLPLGLQGPSEKVFRVWWVQIPSEDVLGAL